ncbi:hypothetical protein CGRA01v4_07866 [Colletotrichum graminicola]|nr:hypothetical protein CGRA01v4_07866 [Colletotrichum graminicola]
MSSLASTPAPRRSAASHHGPKRPRESSRAIPTAGSEEGSRTKTQPARSASVSSSHFFFPSSVQGNLELGTREGLVWRPPPSHVTLTLILRDTRRTVSSRVVPNLANSV